MVKKKYAAIMLLTCFLFLYQTSSAHASFFLFNIIHGIFAGTSSSNAVASQPEPPKNPLLKVGMRNNRVLNAQQLLIRARYLNGTADGVFGYRTLQAVRDFQNDAGLRPDGVIGTRTLSALTTFKGTRPAWNKPAVRQPAYPPVQNENGIPHYLYTLPVLTTAYTRYDEGCTDYTYRGTYLRKGLVAVDPDVIPLGTRLYIPGYGEAVADDIGGAIRGNHIDLAMDTVDEAYGWGTKHLTVYVLPKV